MVSGSIQSNLNGEWRLIANIFSFSSRKVFEDIRPPYTPIREPLLFVAICSAVFAYVIVPFIAVFVGTEPGFQNGVWINRFFSGIVLQVPLTLLCVLLSAALAGTYYFVVTRCAGIVELRWVDWFGFAWWTFIPSILGEGAWVFLNGDYSGLGINPVSLFTGLFMAVVCLVLPTIWTLCLSVQGLRIWTNKGWSFCILVSILPYPLIYSVIFLMPEFR